MPEPAHPAPVVDPALSETLPAGTRHRFVFRLPEAPQSAVPPLRLRIGDASWPATIRPDDSDPDDGSGALAAVFDADLPRLPGSHVWALIDGTKAGAPVSLCDGHLEIRPLTVRLGAYGDTTVLGREPVLHRRMTAKCLDTLSMAGRELEILSAGEPARVVARVTLGDVPVEGSDALFEGRAEIPVPSTAGEHRFTARPVLGDGEPAMSWNEILISVERVVAPLRPLRVTVRDAATGAPLPEVHVRARRWTGRTDAAGCACLDLPAGRVRLSFWRAGYGIDDLDHDHDHAQAGDLSVVATPAASEPLPWEY